MAQHGTSLKPLQLVEQDLSQVCLIDNSPISFMVNQDNSIPIDTWVDDPHDEALLDLPPFLDALRFADDVRSVLAFRTHTVTSHSLSVTVQRRDDLCRVIYLRYRRGRMNPARTRFTFSLNNLFKFMSIFKSLFHDILCRNLSIFCTALAKVNLLLSVINIPRMFLRE